MKSFFALLNIGNNLQPASLGNTTHVIPSQQMSTRPIGQFQEECFLTEEKGALFAG
jgi:hypothetical protein